ncbi:unnamed protein product, partial [Symbiodinium necroappetens]
GVQITLCWVVTSNLVFLLMTTYDKVNDPTGQDLTTTAGFLKLIKSALRLKEGGLTLYSCTN